MNFNEIFIVCLKTGTLVSAFERKNLGLDLKFGFFQMSGNKLNGIRCIDSHQSKPLIVVGTECGHIHLFDVSSGTEINHVGEYFLGQRAIQNVKLISSNNQLIVFDESGSFYFIEVIHLVK